MYGDIAKLVVGHDDMTQILQCTTDWADIGDIADRVCSCKLGFGMFGWAQQHVTAAKLSALMSKHIGSLEALASIGEKEVAGAEQCIADESELGGHLGPPISVRLGWEALWGGRQAHQFSSRVLVSPRWVGNRKQCSGLVLWASGCPQHTLFFTDRNFVGVDSEIKFGLSASQKARTWGYIPRVSWARAPHRSPTILVASFGPQAHSEYPLPDRHVGAAGFFHLRGDGVARGVLGEGLGG